MIIFQLTTRHTHFCRYGYTATTLDPDSNQIFDRQHFYGNDWRTVRREAREWGARKADYFRRLESRAAAK